MKHKFLALAIASFVGVPALHAADSHFARLAPSSPPAAQTSKSQPTTKASPAKDTTHVMNADFVAYDVKTKTMTVKDDKGQTSTAPLEGRALHDIGRLHLKDGDHLMLTYRDNAKGEHQAVVEIKPANRKT